MKLYGYWRSSATWRVRIVMAHKGIDYTYVPVHLVNDGGEQHKSDYVSKNASHQVPTLEFEHQGETLHLGQSVAIMEYLEALHPTPAMLPNDPIARAKTRQLGEIINAGTQPLQNLAVIQKLKGMDVDAKAWCAEWIEKGLRAFEATTLPGTFSAGENVSWADACLIPQMYNARRFEVDLDQFPRLLNIEAACEKLDAFQAAHPNQQPDATP